MKPYSGLNYPKNHCGLNLQVIEECFAFPAERPTIPVREHSFMAESVKDIISQFISDKTNLIIEIGSWLGTSARFMADNAPNAKVIAIDTFFGSLEHNIKRDDIILFQNQYETFLTNCWDYRGRIIPLRRDSYTALQMLHVADVKPDLIFIDGSHDYDNVKQDFEFCLDLFDNKPVIVGDDWFWETVRAAAIDVAAERNIHLDNNGTGWWVVQS